MVLGGGCGARLWVWGQAMGMGPAWWLVAGMAGEGGRGHQDTTMAIGRVGIRGR